MGVRVKKSLIFAAIFMFASGVFARVHEVQSDQLGFDSAEIMHALAFSCDEAGILYNLEDLRSNQPDWKVKEKMPIISKHFGIYCQDFDRIEHFIHFGGRSFESLNREMKAIEIACRLPTGVECGGGGKNGR